MKIAILAGSGRGSPFRDRCGATQTRRVCLLQQISQSDKLIFVQLDFLVHFEELGVFDCLFGHCKFLLNLRFFSLLLFYLLLKRHDQVSLSLISLRSLNYGCESIASDPLILLSILNVLILLQELF